MADPGNQRRGAQDSPPPEAQVRALYEHAESHTAQAFEELVSKPSFCLMMPTSCSSP
jgi:hypothetical protein